MTADELIDSYVADVVLLLPRKQRRDVAQELSALLREEVDAMAGGQAPQEREEATPEQAMPQQATHEQATREDATPQQATRADATRADATPQQAAREDTARADATREEAARTLLAGFGRPADVAARYGSPVTLVDPADTRTFLTLAAAGAVVIPFGAILRELIVRSAPQRNLQHAVDNAWPTVFAWLGLLVVGFAVAAWARRRRPDAGWKPHPMPTDRINRAGRTAAIVFFALGTLVLTDPSRLIRVFAGGRAAPAAYDALTYDDGFLRLRGPVVLSLMIAGLVVQAALVWQGRWRPWSQRADMAYSLAVCVVLTWVVGAGPIFRTTPTDQSVKGAIALVVLVTLVDLAIRIRRQRVRQAVERPPLTH